MPIRGEGKDYDTPDVARATVTAEVSVTAQSSAAGDTCMTIGPAEFEGGNYYVDVFAPYLTLGTTNLDVELWVDGVFSQSLSGHMAAAVTRPGCTLRGRVALTAGVHTLTVKAFVDAGTGKFGAGAGTTGVAPNALGRVYPG